MRNRFAHFNPEPFELLKHLHKQQLQHSRLCTLHFDCLLNAMCTRQSPNHLSSNRRPPLVHISSAARSKITMHSQTHREKCMQKHTSPDFVFHLQNITFTYTNTQTLTHTQNARCLRRAFASCLQLNAACCCCCDCCQCARASEVFGISIYSSMFYFVYAPRARFA